MKFRECEAIKTVCKVESKNINIWILEYVELLEDI